MEECRIEAEPTTDPTGFVPAAAEALGRGDITGAVELCRRCLAVGEDGEARLLLGGLAYADDDLIAARGEWEAAFRAFSSEGSPKRAARAATLLAELCWDGLGSDATGRGWLQRARRLLERVGPCAEWGYWELARVACDRPDVDALEESARRAFDIAEAEGDRALAVRALGDWGLALVTRGHVEEGLARLDEALACIATGEVGDLFVVSTTFCAALTAVERAADLERAAEWVQTVRRFLADVTGGRPGVLRTHCRIALGGVFAAAGWWSEAEAELHKALESGPARFAQRVDAVARLAELRIQQGRTEEAAALLAPYEDQLAVAAPLAGVHLARGEPALAAAVARRAADALTGDLLRRAPLLATLVDAELARGELHAAEAAAARLGGLAADTANEFVAGLAAAADGRVARAADRPVDAVASFELAVVHWDRCGRPALVARAHVELAEALDAAGDRAGAVAAARAAVAVADRVGAGRLVDRASAVLRALGAHPPRVAAADRKRFATLTPREAEVLEGLRRGESNAMIAERLYLSPKTVEHHVSRVLAKLGARSRAEAAALAAAAAARSG